jgi:hypothetical protein
MSSVSEFTQSFFTASSKAWKKNKVKYDQACYTYTKDAFKGSEQLPIEVASKSALSKNQRELNKRLALNEEAPLPVRRSPRLYEQHLRETYAYP